MEKTDTVIAHSPSKNLRKFGQAQFIIQLILAAVGFVFCIAAALTDGLIMNPNTYGPVVTSVSAELWSWPIFGTSLLYLLGIMINGNWRWSPVLRTVCAASHVGTLGLFASMSFRTAYDSGYVEPFILACAIMGLTNAWFFVLNLGDTLRAVRCGNEN